MSLVLMYEIGGFYRREQGLEVQVLSKSRCREQKRRVKLEFCCLGSRERLARSLCRYSLFLDSVVLKGYTIIVYYSLCLVN